MRVGFFLAFVSASDSLLPPYLWLVFISFLHLGAGHPQDLGEAKRPGPSCPAAGVAGGA